MSLCKNISFVIFLAFLLTGNAFAQDDNIEIANEYYAGGQYEKAKNYYEKIAKKTENLPAIYENYLATLVRLKDDEEAEKLIKKLIKSTPDNLFYRLDHYLFVTPTQGEEKTEKEFSSIVSDIKQNVALVEKAADYLIRHQNIEKAKQVLLAGRKASKDKTIFAVGLANIYYLQGNTEETVEELLNLLKTDPEQLENIENAFQNNLKEEKDFEILENKLYERVQKDPNEIAYNELLLWLNIQKKNFNKAFMQAKAIDKRNKSEGSKLLEVGKIAMDNKDYESAVKFYQYIITEYKDGYNYPIARRELIRAKEESVKNTFPVDQTKIKSLIGDYLSLIKELGNNGATLEARRSVALLYAFYLDKKDTAVVILNEAIALGRGDERVRNKAKIDLGDIYLLKGEPWESTLLYSQVEKEMKEDPLGHEAKLRNAKLNYYKGDFELAQEHLDVLKLATSREISNDAMDLSILIQDNVGLDTTTEAMQDYAAIELLLFQNKITESLAKTDSMIKKYPDHTLTDELYWLKAKIYKKIGDYKNAVIALEKIQSDYPDDILGDDALFMLGSVYEENLKDNAKAMEIYQSFLQKYPGSIYNAEARKRYRLLRGDKL